jgi:tetratricopeptide (TPR) repeat protein
MPQRVKKSYRATLEPPLTVIRTSVFTPPKVRVRAWQIAIACFALIAAVFAIYARTGHFAFVGPDDPVKAGLSRAIQVLSFDAGRHHLINAGLHAVNAVLLFLLLVYVTRALWRSLFAAALFALHPLSVETVAWVAQRGTLLAALFSLASLWAYVRYSERPGWKRYAAVLAALCLALLSAPAPAAIPLAMLLFDWWPLRRSSGTSLRRLLMEKIPLLISAAVFLVIDAIGNSGGAIPLPLRYRIAHVCAAYLQYLEKVFWPRSLAAFYSTALPGTGVLIGAGFVLVIVSAWAIRNAKARPSVLVGWLWSVVLLVPAFLLVRGGEAFLSDRFMYLPLMGISVAIVWAVPERREAVAVGMIAIAVLGVLSWRQTGFWEDKLAVYRHAVSATVDNETLWFRYANALEADGNFDEAAHVFREAIRFLPAQAEIRDALAQVLLQQGKSAEAAEQLREAVRLKPASVSAQKHLGMALLVAGLIDEAKSHLAAAFQADSSDPEVRRLLQMAGELGAPARDASVHAGAAEQVVTPPQVIEWRQLSTEQALELGAVAGFIVMAFLWPWWGVRAFRIMDQALAHAARRPAIALAGVALLPMAARLALLPWYPVPEPVIADEFGHLLLADTFAEGRLANPPHPMAEHFESIYVLQKPSYTSIYPMAQGLWLATAKVLGLHPWIAVWASVGLMCAAMYWMLAGWIPARWALLGALMVALRWSVLSHWMNTYWGGAVAAIGGALVFGALPRIFRRGGWRPAVALGVGLAILAQTRPYEGFLVAVPVGIALLLWMARARGRRARVILPLGAVVACAVAFTAYYDWRVTGNPAQLPYLLYQKLYGVPQSFYWRPPVPPGNSVKLPELEANYRWQLDMYNASRSWTKMREMALVKAQAFWSFYLQPAWTLPLIALPFAWRDRRLRFLIAAAAFVLAGVALYPILLPHYVAPVSCIVIAVVVTCIRRLRVWRWRGRPVGAALASGVLLLSVTGLFTAPAGADLMSGNLVYSETPRVRISKKLEARGGRHLIIVHYGPNHVFHLGFVYNGANIDDSSVVWARDLGPAKNQELIRYYPDRMVWWFDGDAPELHLAPYLAR